MFNKINFPPEQIERYYRAAAKDLRLAISAEAPELAFYACYNVVVKTAMAICAYNNLRVKSRAGHHSELISKLAGFLEDKEIEDMAERMRSKRNRDLYDGGVPTSAKEAEAYILFCKKLVKKAEDYLFPGRLL